jgi:hypothetical protein
MTPIPLKHERAHAQKNRSHETCKPTEQHIAGVLEMKEGIPQFRSPPTRELKRVWESV